MPVRNHQNPIGVFDSGIGGLTVYREIRKRLPAEGLIYLGDTARVPYGSKSAATVTRYAIQNVRFLMERQVKMVVVACNTASAYALTELQTLLPVPVIGVIEPGVAGALRTTRSLRIGIIGTEGTIRSGAYRQAITRQRPEAHLIDQPCPLFVPLVEEGWWKGEIVREVAATYLSPIIGEVDTLILGCTHYPLLKPVLGEIAEGITLIDSAEETAREVEATLQGNGLLRTDGGQTSPQFFVTDSPERFQRVGEMLLGHPLTGVEHIEV